MELQMTQIIHIMVYVLYFLLRTVICARDRIIRSLLHFPVLPHFPRVPPKSSGGVTFNSQRQQHDFVSCSCVKIDASAVIYHGTHNKHYYFTDTSELWSGPPATFPFGTRFVLCKDKHLYVPHPESQKVDHDIVQVWDIDIVNGKSSLFGEYHRPNVDIVGNLSYTMEK